MHKCCILLAIIYHDFLPPPRRGIVMSSQITRTQSSNIHQLARILDACPLIFISCDLFTVFSNHIMLGYPTPIQVITTDHGRAVRKNTGPSKNGRLKLIQYICTRALHSFLSFSTIIPLLPNATSTPFIKHCQHILIIILYDTPTTFTSFTALLIPPF